MNSESIAASILKKHLNEYLLLLLYRAEKTKRQGYRYPGKWILEN